MVKNSNETALNHLSKLCPVLHLSSTHRKGTMKVMSMHQGPSSFNDQGLRSTSSSACTKGSEYWETCEARACTDRTLEPEPTGYKDWSRTIERGDKVITLGDYGVTHLWTKGEWTGSGQHFGKINMPT